VRYRLADGEDRNEEGDEKYEHKDQKAINNISECSLRLEDVEIEE
jgi:hypothetical protein